MKKCPNFGKYLDYCLFKCSHCNTWLYKEVFDKLTEKDVNTIKDQNLLICPPSLLALQISTVIFKEEFKTTRKKISEDLYLFNNLVFKSFVLFHWSFILCKKRNTITKIRHRRASFHINCYFNPYVVKGFLLGIDQISPGMKDFLLGIRNFPLEMNVILSGMDHFPMGRKISLMVQVVSLIR